MTHALAGWREEFPILARKTYLCSHSLGAVPRATAASLARYYEEWAGEGILSWDGPWWRAVTEFGEALEAILGAPPGSVAPMENATRAMAAVASCFDWKPPRNRVVLTDLEFTTSYPFWRGCEREGATVVIVPSEDGMSVPAERLAAAVDERTRLVATSHVYFRSAAVQDLGAVVAAAHRAGALVLGDGYQAAGILPVDLQALGVDFYVGGCHKWLLGGPGGGYLYVRPDLAATLRPRLTGWFGLASPMEFQPGTGGGEPHPGVLRFLGGTPNVPGLYAAREGLAIVRKVGVRAIREVTSALATRLVEGALERGIEVRTPKDPRARTAMVCLQFSRSREAARALIEEGVIVDWRPDCGLRASPHFYNVEEEIDRLLRALERWV